MIWRKQGKTISLHSLFDQFGTQAGPFGDMRITGASLVLDLEQKGVIVAISLGQLVKVGCFNLANVTFTFFRSSTSTQASLTATAWIDAVDLDISASYDSTNSQWAFAGAAARQTPIPVKAVKDDLAKRLGIELTTFPSTTGPQISTDSLLDATLRDVLMTFQCGNGDTTFQFAFELDAGGWDMHLSFEYKVAKGTVDVPPSKETTAQLTLAVGELEFDVTYEASGKLKALIGNLKSASHLNIATLLQLLQIDSGFASSAKIGLREAAIIRFTLEVNAEVKSGWVLAAELDASFDLSQIPIAGAVVSRGGALKVDGFTIFGASTAVPPEVLAAIKQYLAGYSIPDALPKGASFGGKLTVGSDTHDFHALSPDVTATEAGTPDPPPVPANGARWFTVGKSLGPLSVKRIGVELRKNGGQPEIGFLLDAGFSLSVLNLELDGLEVILPISASPTPRFELRGLEIGYSSGPVSISGGFLDVTPPPDDLKCLVEGEALLRTPTLSLSALGEYAQMTDGEVSVAIFAVLNYPIGGPAFAFVTGLAAGFGYNSHLRIPTTLSELITFPLLEAAMPGQTTLKPDASPRDSLKVLGAWITPKPGEMWLAAGVMIRSFQMINTLALLTVEFGKEFQVALFGRSQMTIPPNAPEKLAYAELDVMATFDPQVGTVKVLGVLSQNSWVIAPECHLSGGFAFCLWETGKFVVTYGGYHPRFNYAAQGFPKVPRLQFHWQLDSHTQVKGSEYFALTGGVMMAGGGLEATWESGVFSASFTLTADFLMEWRPFHFEADLSMSIAVEFTLDIAFVSTHFSFHLGVGVHLEGPPLHGTAEIDLSVVSFTVTFGSSNQETAALKWDGFLPLLPGHDQAADGFFAAPKAKVLAGLVEDHSKSGHDSHLGAINPKELLIHIETVVPVNVLIVVGGTKGYVPGAKVDNAWTKIKAIGPMNADIGESDSTLELTLKKWDGTRFKRCEGDHLTFVPAPVPREAPAALWSKRPSNNSDRADSINDTSIQNVLTEVRIQPTQPPVDSTNAVDLKSLLVDDDPLNDRTFPFAGTAGAQVVPSGGKHADDLKSQLLDRATARQKVAAALAGAGWKLGNDELGAEEAANTIAGAFWDQPPWMPLS